MDYATKFSLQKMTKKKIFQFSSTNGLFLMMGIRAQVNLQGLLCFG